MRRKLKQERVERIRITSLIQVAEHLRRKAARWAKDHLDILEKADPIIPPELNDRAGDSWRPLLAIADLSGGSWPDDARKAALSLSGLVHEESSVAMQLLSDIRTIFRGNDRLPSQTIVEELAKREDRPWPEWKNGKPISTNQLARQLSRFEIRPKKIRFGSNTAQGYELEQFSDAFIRYLDPQTGTSEQCTDGGGFAETLKPNMMMNVPDVENHNSRENKDVPDVPTSGSLLDDRQII
jgi:putative DNA primase/helicase